MDERIKKFVEWLNEQYRNEKRIFGYECLKVSYRIFEEIPGHRLSLAVYCFVDFEGNIYKADGWKKPAKHVRGHVDSPEKCCERYSIIYSR